MRRYAVRHWASVAPASAVLLVTAAAAVLGRLSTVGRTSGDSRDHLPRLLLGALLAPSPLLLLVALVALVVVLGLAERVMGSARTMLAWSVCAVAVPLAGRALDLIGVVGRRLGPAELHELAPMTPLTPVLGVALASSAYCGPRWQRRIRVLGLAALAVDLLYSGRPAALFQLLSAAIGLVLGILLARRRPLRYWAHSSHHEARILVGTVIGVTAIGPLVSVSSPRGYGPLRPLGRLFRDTLPRMPAHLPCPPHAAACYRDAVLARLNGPGPLLLTVLPLLVLGGAALGAWRGRRIAAWTAVAVEGVLAVLAATSFGLLPLLGLRGRVGGAPSAETVLQGVLAVLVPLGVVALIVVNLRSFKVPADPAVLRRGALGFGAVVVIGAVGYVIALTVHGQVASAQTPIDVLAGLPERYVPAGFLPLDRAGALPVREPARFLDAWIGPAAWGAALLALLACDLRPARAATSAERARARVLLHAGGSGSLSWMATWEGTRYWFSPDGASLVAFRATANVAVTLGEPVGPADRTLAAARQFAIACDAMGLTPVFYAVRPELAAALSAERAWPSVPIGQDTLIDPGTFAMTGKRWQDVRSSINRADRAGVTAVWTTWDQASYSTRNQLQSIADEWIAERRLPELEFTVGGIQELKDPEVHLMLAVGPDGRVEAATSWLPTYRDDAVVGWTLDFMRRRPGGLNGLMEFLIASTVRGAQDRGLEFVSLSVAPLAGIGGAGRGDVLVRALERVSGALEPVYGFASLESFKSKFQPRVEPLVMAYPDVIALPAIAVAVGRIYLPGFSVPSTARLLNALR